MWYYIMLSVCVILVVDKGYYYHLHFIWIKSNWQYGFSASWWLMYDTQSNVFIFINLMWNSLSNVTIALLYHTCQILQIYRKFMVIGFNFMHLQIVWELQSESFCINFTNWPRILSLWCCGNKIEKFSKASVFCISYLWKLKNFILAKII